MENAAVRTSTDATFVLATIVPSNQVPGSIVSVENHIATIRGGALGTATGAVGIACGGRSETIRFDGTVTGREEHAPRSILHDAANDAAKAGRKGFRAESKDDCRKMKLMDLLSAREAEGPSVPRFDVVEPSPSPTRLDWLITLAGVWIISGLFIDAHQHLFLAVESFLNPWHMTMYSGAVFAAVVLAAEAAPNYRRTGSFWKSLPPGYVQSAFGVAALLLGGAMDFAWHAAFGFEHQLDLLLSPPHLFLLTGLFFLITGPVRSGLLRRDAANLAGQLPMLISLGLAFEIIQFVTQYGFYPEALMRDHPLSQIAHPNEQFTLSVFLFYRQALEIAIVIWQSLLLAASVLYLTLTKRLHFGAIAIICVGEKLWIGGELSTDILELALVLLASLAAGLAGDLILAKLRPSAQRPNAFRLLGFVVPAAYFAAYFIFAVPLFGGTWWDASFVFGSIAEAGIVGVCISQLLLAGSHNTRTA